MSKQFTPCPACGAVGEVGSNCQFCGTAIILKEGAIPSDARIVKRRTVTPQQYAEKISIYHNVVGLNSEISKVSIGEQEGIINLNGDIIYPLGNERISKNIQKNIIKIGEKFLNLENFEFVKNPYFNELIFEKIKILSDAILNDPSVEGDVRIGPLKDHAGYDTMDGLIISNIHPTDVEYYGLSPQLEISFGNSFCGTDDELRYRLERLKSCDDFCSFKTYNINTLSGEIIPELYRIRYILCGYDVERCTEIVLQVLYQAFDISPEDAHNHMECYGDIFGDDNIIDNAESTNSGCAGMFALMLSIGAASVYGLIEFIGSLIA